MQDLEKMEKLLEDVRVLTMLDNAERFKQGKKFNVFEIQGTNSDEVKVCRFLRELLDPKGSHGQGSVFLKLFLKEVLECTDYEILTTLDIDGASVEKEKLISNDRRIDLYIKIGNRHFPIEVKIYAEDQPAQCYDYYQYVKNNSVEDKKDDVTIYYLTLDGHEPSKKSKESSSSEESKKYLPDDKIKCLSFEDDILNWLTNCIKSDEIEQIYSIREILIQFKKSIEYLTGKDIGGKRMEIKNKISESNDNFLAALEISKAIKEVKVEKMTQVFDDIRNYMENERYGEYCVLESYKDASSKYYDQKTSTWPSINYIIPIEKMEFKDESKDNLKENFINKLVFRFEIGEFLYYGVCPWNDKEKNNWSGEGKTEEKNIVDNITPKGYKETDEAHWYWKENINDEVDFRNCNEAYASLYDKDEYKKLMGKIYEKIDKVVTNILIE